jgi:uncharacterized membrane protein HdeD (DUF308 family)
MKDTFAPYRRRFEHRFGHGNDWRRLAILGVLVISFSALALADALAPTPFPDHFGGGSAIFSGIAVLLLIQKISRTRIYVDWMFNAIFYIGVGLTLYADEALDHILPLVLVCTFLFASGLSRIWIGVTGEPQAAASWMLSSGCIALFSVLWIAGDQAFQMPTTPSIILALDALFQGISIAGFGLSLKDAR